MIEASEKKKLTGIYIDEMKGMDLSTAFKYQGNFKIGGEKHIMGYSDSKEWFEQEVAKSKLLQIDGVGMSIEVVDNPLYVPGDKDRLREALIETYRKLC